MRAMTIEYSREQAMIPVPHVLLRPRDPAAPVLVEIGRDRDSQFSGTDAMSMSFQPDVIAWLATIIPRRTYPLILAEGDRLANVGFFRAVADAGARLLVVHLTASAMTIAERRGIRAMEVGRTQNESWLHGRRTKTQRLARSLHAVPVSTEESPDVVADVLWTLLESGHESPVPADEQLLFPT
jgi:hypothetical protein